MREYLTSGLPPGDGVIPWLLMLAVAAVAVSPVGHRIFSILGWIADRLVQRTAVAVTVVAIVAFFVAAIISYCINFPEPVTHDEFSYLLAGETFAKGRLTNPTDPLWEFFETIHVIEDPTYQSKYPPAQGMMLAAGIVLAGEPILGVWLGTALACAALTWMLLAWLPRRWALAGGFIAAIHPVMLQWGQNYWGGAAALAGGALVLGAMRRLWDGPKFGDGIVLGVGVLILANSRPFEGLLLCAPVAVALLLWIVFRARGASIKTLVVPSLLVLVPGACWMGYYNWRVTGHAWVTPYMQHDRLYNRTPHFVWQEMKPPKTWNNPELAAQHGQWEPAHWERQQTFGGWISEVRNKMWNLWRGFFWPVELVIPLLMLPALLRRDRWMQLAAAVLFFFLMGITTVTWKTLLHYAAPVMPAALALLVGCMLQMAQRGRWWRAALQVVLALLVLSVWPSFDALQEAQASGPQVARAKIVNTILAAHPDEKQLFIVHYLPSHREHIEWEWVYNGPDIDAQQVIWARDLGPQKLPKLLEQYKDRRKWILEVGAVDVTPRPLGWKLE